MRVLLVCFFTLITLTNCNSKQNTIPEKENTGNIKKSSCDVVSYFNPNDTSGTYTGIVTSFVVADTTINLTIKSKSGNEILFLGNPKYIKNYDSLRLTMSTCIKVKYYAHIMRIEGNGSVDGEKGDETERDLYITEIKFLE